MKRNSPSTDQISIEPIVAVLMQIEFGMPFADITRQARISEQTSDR